tara:strand:+ start:263 stop:457 length:195 start_codon:yes stop_codon:yes gene_type:complete
MTTLETGSLISGIIILILIILFWLLATSLDKREARKQQKLDNIIEKKEKEKYTHPHATTNKTKI